MITLFSVPQSTSADSFAGARGIRPALLVRRVPFRGTAFLPAPDRDLITSAGRDIESHREDAPMLGACGDDDLMSQAQ